MVLIALVIAGASAITNAQRSAAPGATPSAPSQEVVVRPGDTVASVASRIGPAAEHDKLVALIRAANGLSGAADAPLPAGQYLIVPAA